MNLLASLVLASWLTLGYMPNGGVEAYEKPSFLSGAESFLVEIGAEVSLGSIFIGGSMRVPIWQISWNSYFPSQLISTFEAGLEVGPIRLAYRHGCSHAVVPYLPIWYEGSLVPSFDSGYNLFYLTIKGGKR